MAINWIEDIEPVEGHSTSLFAVIHPISVVLIMLLEKKFKCAHIWEGRNVPITIKMFHKGNQEVDKGEIVAPREREDRNSSNKLVVLARLRHQHLNLKDKNPDSSDPSERAAVLRQRDYKRYFFFFGILWKLSGCFLIKTLANFNKNFSKAHKNIADRRRASATHDGWESAKLRNFFDSFFSHDRHHERFSQSDFLWWIESSPSSAWGSLHSCARIESAWVAITCAPRTACTSAFTRLRRAPPIGPYPHAIHSDS